MSFNVCYDRDDSTEEEYRYILCDEVNLQIFCWNLKVETKCLEIEYGIFSNEKAKIVQHNIWFIFEKKNINIWDFW